MKFKFTDLKKAINELNNVGGLLEEKISLAVTRKKNELIEDFCNAIEGINEAGGIDKISDFVFNFYNDNFTEEESEEVEEVVDEKDEIENEVENEIEDNEMKNEVKEDEKVIDIDKEEVAQEESIVVEDNRPKTKKEKPKKKNTENIKKCKFKSGSRPFVLYEKMKEGKKLEELLVDEEVLAKFNNKKSWIKGAFVRISKEIEIGN